MESTGKCNHVDDYNKVATYISKIPDFNLKRQGFRDGPSAVFGSVDHTRHQLLPGAQTQRRRDVNLAAMSQYPVTVPKKDIRQCKYCRKTSNQIKCQLLRHDVLANFIKFQRIDRIVPGFESGIGITKEKVQWPQTIRFGSSEPHAGRFFRRVPRVDGHLVVVVFGRQSDAW